MLRITFTLFLLSSLRNNICQWTNHKGAIVYGSSWKPVDDGEFKVFLGVVILIDVYKFNNESVAQSWSTLDGQPISNRPTSRKRYRQILHVFRFGQSQSRRRHRSSDKLQPIRKVFETRDSYLSDSYCTCGPSMTVDEQLVSFKGRCHFKQYIPSKPGKYGIKIWTICDSTCFYTWKIQVYIVKDGGSGQETNQGTRVVLDLVEAIENSGQNITCDNFFTDLSLARTLLQKKLALIEPMRKNKPEPRTKFTVVK